MGTNFYVLSREKHEKRKRYFDEETDDEEYGEYERLRDAAVHIGKRSAGWNFTFNATRFKSYKEWLNYLNDATLVIVDEYDRVFTFNDFKKEVERLRNKPLGQKKDYIPHHISHPNRWGTIDKTYFDMDGNRMIPENFS